MNPFPHGLSLRFVNIVDKALTEVNNRICSRNFIQEWLSKHFRDHVNLHMRFLPSVRSLVFLDDSYERDSQHEQKALDPEMQLFPRPHRGRSQG